MFQSDPFKNLDLCLLLPLIINIKLIPAPSPSPDIILLSFPV